MYACDVAHLQHDVARLPLGSVGPVEHRPADHQAGELGHRRACGRDAGGRHPPAPHHGDPIRDREDLAELVADEDDAASGRRHGPERAEELVDLVRGEDGRRLVHDQDAGAAMEELQQLDPLLLTDGELPDVGSRVDV